MRVAVIGAGPSGLVTLKYLLQAHQSLGCHPVEAILFDYQPNIGGTFAARTYEDAEVRAALRSIKTTTKLTVEHSWSHPSSLQRSRISGTRARTTFYRQWSMSHT